MNSEATLRVGVIGYKGRMGVEVCSAVEAAEALELAARVGRDDPLDRLVEAGVDVVVEFSTPASVKENVLWCVDNGLDTVVGATGLLPADIDEISARAGDTRVFVAPNFALGAVLMMAFAAKAAPFFLAAEVVERHHENKADAPSGTALRTAALMNEARSASWPVVPQSRESIAGSRGGDADGVRVHALRIPGSVAHQEVIFGGRGETLTIRHDSLDRSSFMPGVMLAIKRVKELEGVVVGLEKLLDL